MGQVPHSVTPDELISGKFVQDVPIERASVVSSCVTDDDLREVVGLLVTMAKAGDLKAMKELFDRVVGRPIQAPAAAELGPREYAAMTRAFLRDADKATDGDHQT